MKAAFSNISGSYNDDEYVQQFIDQVPAFDSLSRSQITSIVFSYSDFRVLYVSPAAATYFGTTTEEIKEKGSLFLLQFFSEYQRRFAVETAEWIANVFEKADCENLMQSGIYYVNWRITNKQGQVHQSLCHVFPVVLTADGKPQLGVYLIYDIKPYIYPDSWWVRFKLNQQTYLYHPEQPRFEEGDIFSAREHEVLTHLAQGLTSRQIAERLQLSSNTVDNHRRRMLQWSGAVDTTALIHISKMCGIL
jgi:DNA-binding CsgD family transcriptional regulator